MKKVSKCMALLLAFVMIFTVVPVSQVEAAKVNVKSVTAASSLSGSKKSIVVAKGKKVKLDVKVKVTPNKKANKKVTYTSKNTNIAKVDAKGNVKGVKAGSTSIEVTSKANKNKKATIKVKVTKGAVTKVSLNKKSGTINVGGSVALKATVKAKSGADKTIAWTSSNKKVAVVDKKGKVTAVGAGKATIKASAIDGSGKKATYQVTVKDPISMNGISILNEQSIVVSLNKACTLTTDMISVMTKRYQNGEYRNQCVIENMSTTDSVNYTLVLANDSRISANQYVKVSIPSLSGSVKSMEKLYSEPVSAYTYDSVSKWTVGTYDSVTYDSEDASYGGVTLSINALPAGLTAESKNSELVIKGTPTKAGVTQGVISAVDELGNTSTRTVTFIVGSDAVVSAASTPSYGVLSGTELYISNYISAVGGSGYYNYQVINDPNGIVKECNSDGEVYVSIAFSGNYNVTVRVTDANDSGKYCDVVLSYKIAQGITIGGSVTDAQGNKITSGVSVSFRNKDKANRYRTYAYGSVNRDGVYSAVVVPGNYDITVNYTPDDYYSTSLSARAKRYLYNQPLTVSKTGYDLSLPLYKVILVSAKNPNGSDVIDVEDRAWYYNNECVGEGSTLYLKAGSYRLESEHFSDDNQVETGDWFNGGKITTTKTTSYGAADVNLVNRGVQAVVNKVTLSSQEVDTFNWIGVKGQTNTISLDEWYELKNPYYGYKYVPTDSGTYKLGIYYIDEGLYMFDENGNKLAVKTAYAYEKYYELEAGKTYYIASGKMTPSSDEFCLYYDDESDEDESDEDE